jgi:cellulose synthase/poly-beta-1,6-N-acetylglucosamine synthase-like glycosyltransferase
MQSVSIIIPVYNRKNLIKKCLDAALKLRYENYEIIVVDDGSTDGTSAVLEKYNKRYKKIKLIKQKNMGTSIARNRAIKIAKGNITAFTDSDCIIKKNWLRELVKPYSDPKVGGVIGRTFADRKGLFWHHMENAGIAYIGHNTSYRTRIIKKLGGFDSRFNKAFREDTDMAWRVMDLGYKIEFAEKAEMTHLSARDNVVKRIKRQQRFLFDWLLYNKHKERYKELFNGFKGSFLPFFIFVAVFIASIISLFFMPYALLLVAIYVIIILYNIILYGKGGSTGNKLLFILMIWMLPFSRTIAFFRGWWKFRKDDLYENSYSA